MIRFGLGEGAELRLDGDDPKVSNEDYWRGLFRGCSGHAISARVSYGCGALDVSAAGRAAKREGWMMQAETTVGASWLFFARGVPQKPVSDAPVPRSEIAKVLRVPIADVSYGAEKTIRMLCERVKRLEEET